MHINKIYKKISGFQSRLLRYFGVGYGVKDLLPAHQISVKKDLFFLSQGEDPQFRFQHRLSAGWYMVELQMQLPNATADACFYWDFGTGESESQAASLAVRSNRMAKRLLYLPKAATLRFDPMAQEGEFQIQHFRLVRFTQKMAMQRVHKKLGNQKNKETPAKAETVQELWAAYNAIFTPSRGDAVSYGKWIQDIEVHSIPSIQQQIAEQKHWQFTPTISIVLPTYNTPLVLLQECLDSVLAQTYPHWELCIADDASPLPHVKALIAAYTARDARIKYIVRSQNGHISACSNTALTLASGEYVALLDHDDKLAPHALFFVAQALQSKADAQIIYSDEDKLDAQGQRCDPFFKPDWSPDLLYSQNYINHFLVYRRDLVQSVGGFRTGFEGSQDYDLLLRCIAQLPHPSVQEIVHIPHVLYHWRMTDFSTAQSHGNKDYACQAALRALQEYMDIKHPGVRMEMLRPGIYRHKWPLPQELPLVSLIIPTRDGFDILHKCIESIQDKTTYPNYEILIVDNQSTCEKTIKYLHDIEKKSIPGRVVRVLQYNHPFNYSAINNFAVKQANGSIVGLINNDVEVINGDWLSEMVSHAIRPDIGCVGAKLYYPDGSIQHAGVILGIGGVAGHSHKYFPGNDLGYFGRLLTIHNVSAVTAAVLMVQKEIYFKVGMLNDKELTVAFNDVDFCLKVRQAGYRNLWTPFSALYHHESKTRGAETTPGKVARFAAECNVMMEHWGVYLKNDCFYNKNLTLVAEDYSLSNVIH